MPSSPPSSFLIRPAGAACNLACTYCYAAPPSDRREDLSPARMDESLLKTVVCRAMELRTPSTTFVWSGGEPTLAGLDFFRFAVSAQRRFGAPGQIVCNALQTNGLLLDAAWTRFLKEYRFIVGLSMDGMEENHDRHRRTTSGKPSWAEARRAARLLQEAGVDFNILCAVTGPMADQAADLYAFFRKMGIRTAQFLPCFHLEGRPRSVALPVPTPEQWGRFLCDLFDAWWTAPQTAIPFFDSVLHTFLGLPSPECTLRDTCGSYWAIDADGSVYPCDFCMAPEWRLGNIACDSWEAMLEHPVRRDFLALKRSLPSACLSCEWLRQCYGGCPRQRFVPSAGPPGPAWCDSMRLFLNHTTPRFEELARRCRGSFKGDGAREVIA